MQNALASETQRLLDDYLRRLDRALRSVPEPERNEIRVEIESHLRGTMESLPQPVETDDILDMLYRLGEPESYVPLYLTESYLNQGFRKASPLMLAKGVARWLASTTLSYLYSFPFFLLYLVSFFSFAMGTLKLIFPQNIGITYLSNEGSQTAFWFGFTSYTHDPSKGHELLGFWTVPFVWGLGLVTALGATGLLRWMTRRALSKRFEIE